MRRSAPRPASGARPVLGVARKRVSGATAVAPSLATSQLDVFELIAAGASLDDVLARIAEIARLELDVPSVSIDLADARNSLIRTAASPGLPPAYAEGVALITNAVRAVDTQSGSDRRGRRGSVSKLASAAQNAIAAKIRQVTRDLDLAECRPCPVLTSKGVLAGFLTIHGKPKKGRLSTARIDALVRLTRIAMESAQQVQSADRRFASLAATVPGVVYQRLVSPDGDIRYTYISEGVRDLFGVGPDEVLADPTVLFDCYDPEYRKTLHDRLLAASRSLELWDVQVQIVTTDGQEKWTHAIARPHRQADGAVMWTGIILDATRIKKTEIELRRAKDEAEKAHRAQAELVEKLRSADERFTSLAHTIPGVVYQRIVTPDGDIRYTYISDGARDLFGVEPEDVIADPQAIFQRHGPEYRKNFRQRLLAASRSLSMWDVEAQIVTADGEEKWTHAIARPHRQPDGSVLWDGVILDATRIKQAELELRRAMEAAEQANRAKTQFLASMSHELRTPLNAIIGFSEILKSEVYGPLGNSDYVQYAGYVHRSAHGLLDTINSILEFTKFETLDVVINDRSVHIGDVIRSAVAQARSLTDEATIEIVGPSDEELPILICDEELVRRMLVHLLSNGVKFTPEEGRVEIGAELMATGDLAITVQDDGIGIAEEDMPKIFEAFGQIDGTLSRHYGGSGLGVPLAVSMAKLHGADLMFDSALGRGTTVTVVFPKERVIGRARKIAAR